MDDADHFIQDYCLILSICQMDDVDHFGEFYLILSICHHSSVSSRCNRCASVITYQLVAIVCIFSTGTMSYLGFFYRIATGIYAV
jgi:hypothetical protein